MTWVHCEQADTFHVARRYWIGGENAVHVACNYQARIPILDMFPCIFEIPHWSVVHSMDAKFLVRNVLDIQESILCENICMEVDI